jgi:hypothetical protein
MEMMASVDEGILDMIGPRTLEGGYSPSQVMSSAKRVVEVVCSEILGAKATWLVTRVAVWAAGTKAEETATIAARRRMLRRAMFEVYYLLLCAIGWIFGKVRREGDKKCRGVNFEERKKVVRITISTLQKEITSIHPIIKQQANLWTIFARHSSYPSIAIQPTFH